MKRSAIRPETAISGNTSSKDGDWMKLRKWSNYLSVEGDLSDKIYVVLNFMN